MYRGYCVIFIPFYTLIYISRSDLYEFTLNLSLKVLLMKNFNRILVSFLILFCSVFAFGQMIPPADWGLSAPTENVKIGSEIELVFKADVPKDFHLYSNSFSPSCGPVLATFKYESNSGFKLIGEAIPVGDHHYEDEAFGCDVADFEGVAEFRQKIKITGPNPVVVGLLEYQMCSNVTGQCVLHEYEYSIQIKTAGAGDAPADPTTPKADPVLDQSTTVDAVSSISSDDCGSPCDSMILAKLDDMAGKKTGIEAHGLVPKAEVNYQEFKKQEGDETGCEVKSYEGGTKAKPESFLWFFIIAFLSGLTALLTPCVFPMIPMTVSFFMKEGSRAKAIRTGLIYAASIIAIYVLIGTIVAMTAGESAANFLSTHWLPNVFFFLIFVIFAASFFGAFEITLPSWLVNKADQQADKGGLVGIFFMAFTIVLVSFSCTGPIVGSILVESAGGQFVKPLVGMLGFSLAFAIPFGLFAIFPNWLNNLPKSGGWLNSVKVVLGFLELALGLKFLSVADQTYHWGILDREVYIGLWIVIFFLLGIYLLGKLKFSHDSDLPYVSVPRLLFAVATFTFVVYLIPGLWGAPLKALAGYMPPMSTHDFNMVSQITNPSGHTQGYNNVEPKYNDKLHLPYGIKGYFDYEQGMEVARQVGKPVFLDFTGHGCVNCREMEARVWSDARVLKFLSEEYVVISLYVDDKSIMLEEDEWYVSKYSGKLVKTLAKKNSDIQACLFNSNAQPQYALMDNRAELLQAVSAYDLNADNYVEFLKAGLKEYKKRMNEELNPQ